MRCRPSPWDAPPGDSGYTLLELVIVVGLISVLAAVALPGMRPANDEGFDAAAAWMAETIRFARAEAMRTGEPVYVEIDRDTKRFLVAAANLSGGTAVAGAALRDPITKQPLDVILSSVPVTAGTDIGEWPFAYPGGGRQGSVVFNAEGLPFRKAGGVYEPLALGEIRLVRAAEQRTVRIERVTGRVTVQ